MLYLNEFWDTKGLIKEFGGPPVRLPQLRSQEARQTCDAPAHQIPGWNQGGQAVVSS